MRVQTSFNSSFSSKKEKKTKILYNSFKEMKSILANASLDSSFSLSKRYFNWKKKKVQEDDEEEEEEEDDYNHNEEKILTRFNFSSDPTRPAQFNTQQIMKKKKKKTIEKIRYALGFSNPGLGFRVVGTLFGNRRGHVYFSVQDDPTRLPAVLIQLPTPTSVLVREMASGQVRIALETAAFKTDLKKKLLEESTWRTYCNGKKCGYAARKECGGAEWKVLKAVGPITMGAGVLPATTTTVDEEGNGAVGSEKGELMYMRAMFERVIGSRDSEAFYMINPDVSSGGPELSVYFLRV